MASRVFGPSVRSMRRTFPVIWSLHGDTQTGKLEVTKERMELTSRGYTFAFPAIPSPNSTSNAAPGPQIRGLPSLRIRLVGEHVVRVASLGGAGSLHEISALLAAAGRQEGVSQRLAGAGT